MSSAVAQSLAGAPVALAEASAVVATPKALLHARPGREASARPLVLVGSGAAEGSVAVLGVVEGVAAASAIVEATVGASGAALAAIGAAVEVDLEAGAAASATKAPTAMAHRTVLLQVPGGHEVGLAATAAEIATAEAAVVTGAGRRSRLQRR